MVLKSLSFCLTLPVMKKVMKNSKFEISEISNILDQGTTSAKTKSMQIIRKLTEYSLKIVVLKTMSILARLKILMRKGNLALRSAQEENVKVNFKRKSKNVFVFCWKCLKTDYLKAQEALGSFSFLFILFNTFSTGINRKHEF